MIVYSTVPTANGMSVHGAVSMDVGHEVSLRVASIWKRTGRVTKGGAGVCTRGISGGLDVGCLQGKLQHRGDHQDDDPPMKPRLVAKPQEHSL
jgi:hypothetical protein